MESTAIGQILRDARETRSLTLDQAAGDTHIRLRYLQALEAGDFDALPSRFQVKGFLRAYAAYLGLDADNLLRMLDGKSQADALLAADSAPAAGDSPQPEASPAARFVEIGQKLRAQRDLLKLSLDDVERHTHLRTRYVKAMEAGDIDALPSPVQGRGMLKNYADFLGLNPDDLLLTFADGLQAGLTERRPETVQPTPAAAAAPALRKKPDKRSRFFNRDLFFATLLVVSLLTFGIWGGLKIAEMRNSPGTPAPTPPSIAEVLLPSPSATLEPTITATTLPAIDEGAMITPNPASPQGAPGVVLTPAGPIGPVRIEIVVRQRAYLRVIVDDEVKFDGRVLPGAVYAFAGEDAIEIVTGSGSALQVVYNAQDLGVLGTYGEAVDFVVTVDGVQTPTPTITPTPTETPTPAVTPTPNS